MIERELEQLDIDPPAPARESELDEFSRATREAGLNYVIESGLGAVMFKLRADIRNEIKDPEERQYVDWGDPSDQHGMKLNRQNSSMNKFMEDLIDIYSLPNGLCEIAIEWPSDAGTDDTNRISVLIHPVTGSLLFQGNEKYLLERAKWQGFTGRSAVELRAVAAYAQPQKLVR